jgi:ABC-type polysaccharide/polyol phosphate transport system ATPase subunit
MSSSWHGNEVAAGSHVRLERFSIDFQIYQPSARLAKKALLQAAVGGLVGRSQDSGRVVLRALQEVTLDIPSGQRVALIGHNGAGKTTLLRAIAGIYGPTGGAISVTGAAVPLFDISLGIDAEATGYENILLRGLLMGLTRADIERKVEDIAEFSELGDYLHLPVRTYSSGMMLRLLFSIVTSVDAKILLMDEWLGAGDQEFIAKADRRMQDIIDRSHILMLASHNVELLQKLCNRGVVLQAGRLVFDGPVEQAIDYYSQRQ